MRHQLIDDLSLDDIMRRWPATVAVFIAWRLHCVGCPIADFHQLADSADEHGYELPDLRRAIIDAIETGDISAIAPRPIHRRSAEDGAGP